MTFDIRSIWPFLVMQVSVLLLTSNWYVGLCGIPLILAVIAIRIPEEERLLLEPFGDEYRSCRKNTGPRLPRLIKVVE